jgi:hypothetical protein
VARRGRRSPPPPGEPRRALQPRAEPFQQTQQQRGGQDRGRGRDQHRAAHRLRQGALLHGELHQEEGELADLPERAGDRHRDQRLHAQQKQQRQRAAAHRHQHRDHRRGGGQRRLRHRAGVEQHADRDEEDGREDALQRRRLGGRLVADIALAQHHAGEEGAKREGDAEQRRGDERHAERDRQHGEREELARAAAGHAHQQPGQGAPAEQPHQPAEGRQPESGLADLERNGAVTRAVRRAGDGRQHHQREDHHQVLHHQPAECDAPGLAAELAALLQRLGRDRGGGDRQREPEGEGRAGGQAEEAHPHRGAERRGERDLQHRPRHRHAPDRQQVGGAEMQPDAE